MLEEDDIDDDDIYGNPSYRPTVIRSRTASRSKPVGKWIHSKSQEKNIEIKILWSSDSVFSPDFEYGYQKS